MSTEPTSAAVRSFYDRVASGYAEVLPDTTFEAPLDLGMLDHFVSLLPEDAAVLDAGCGTGRMITALIDRGVTRALGVDLSPEMIAIARRAHPRARLLVGDIAALPFADGSFDGVLAWYSIIHTPPARLPEVLAELARVLRPGGVLLLGFQAGNGTRIASGSSYRRDGAVGAHRHTVQAVVAAMEEADATVVARAERRDGSAQGFVIGRRSGSVRAG